MSPGAGSIRHSKHTQRRTPRQCRGGRWWTPSTSRLRFESEHPQQQQRPRRRTDRRQDEGRTRTPRERDPTRAAFGVTDRVDLIAGPSALCWAPWSRDSPVPLCDIPSGCCSFTGPWTVTRSSLRMLRRVATFCRPLWPVLLLVSFPRSRSPVVGVLGLCWMRHGVPFACQRRPIVGVLRPRRCPEGPWRRGSSSWNDIRPSPVTRASQRYATNGPWNPHTPCGRRVLTHDGRAIGAVGQAPCAFIHPLMGRSATLPWGGLCQAMLLSPHHQQVTGFGCRWLGCQTRLNAHRTFSEAFGWILVRCLGGGGGATHINVGDAALCWGPWFEGPWCPPVAVCPPRGRVTYTAPATPNFSHPHRIPHTAAGPYTTQPTYTATYADRSHATDSHTPIAHIHTHTHTHTHTEQHALRSPT